VIPQDLFTLPVPVLEKVLRAVLVYLSLIVLLRVFGKRELAQLNPFDLIVLLTLSNTVQNAIIGNDNSFAGGIIGATALLVTNYVVVRLFFRYPHLNRIFGGDPAVLIDKGKVNATALKNELLTARELRIAANRQGIDDLREVECGELEPNGTFSFEKRHISAEQQQRDEISAKLDALNEKIDHLLQSRQ
jgi:uncharacterized membrane protein YcaP (DUF421 family)